MDSGCSKHMTGDKAWFTSFYDEYPVGNVTFGDGQKCPVIGCGIVKTPGIPCLDRVLLVKGLHVSLISVSQTVDDHDEVRFNRSKCIVLNNKGKGVLGAVR